MKAEYCSLEWWFCYGKRHAHSIHKQRKQEQSTFYTGCQDKNQNSNTLCVSSIFCMKAGSFRNYMDDLFSLALNKDTDINTDWILFSSVAEWNRACRYAELVLKFSLYEKLKLLTSAGNRIWMDWNFRFQIGWICFWIYVPDDMGCKQIRDTDYDLLTEIRGRKCKSWETRLRVDWQGVF